MNGRMPLTKLEDNTLWQDTQKLAEQIENIYVSLSEDEQFMTKYRFRNKMYEVSTDVAEACGAFLPKDMEYSLAIARRGLNGLKSSYRYLGVHGSVTIDPDIMVAIDKLIADIDDKVRDIWVEIDRLEASEIPEKPLAKPKDKL